MGAIAETCPVLLVRLKEPGGQAGQGRAGEGGRAAAPAPSHFHPSLSPSPALPFYPRVKGLGSRSPHCSWPPPHLPPPPHSHTGTQTHTPTTAITPPSPVPLDHLAVAVNQELGEAAGQHGREGYLMWKRLIKLYELYVSTHIRYPLACAPMHCTQPVRSRTAKRSSWHAAPRARAAAAQRAATCAQPGASGQSQRHVNTLARQQRACCAR